jgi:vanillate/3-O-methylgallate O-demethylase
LDPHPHPGIYSDPTLTDYRQWLSVFSFEGQKPLHGSAFSAEIEDYYVSPWELGYGRSISFNHNFLGRDALQAAEGNVPRTKVTLELDSDDVRDVLGADLDYLLTYGRYRIEPTAT